MKKARSVFTPPGLQQLMHDTHSTRRPDPKKIPRADAKYRAACGEALRFLDYPQPESWDRSMKWPTERFFRNVLFALIGWAHADGRTNVVRDLIAAECKASWRHVSHAVGCLEALGYIERIRVPGWNSMSFRLHLLAAAERGPSAVSPMDRLAARVRQLEQLEADRFAAVPVYELPQRSDQDDAREGLQAPKPGVVPGAGEASGGDELASLRTFVWEQVRDADTDRKKVPAELACATCCPCWSAPDSEAHNGRYGGVPGGRYRIRICDFVRVKDAVTALPSHNEDPQAVPVVAAIIRERKRKHNLAPRSLRQDAQFCDLLDPIVGDCLALSENHSCDYAAAVDVLVFTMYEYPGSDGKWAAERHRLDWYPHNSRRVFELASERMERKLATRVQAPARPQAAPQVCRGICAGGRFQNPACDECEAMARTREAARLGAEQRARDQERSAVDEAARAREDLATWAAAEGA